MPIFEYRCEDCGTKFEKLVRREGDAAGIACPSCGENRLKQEFSTFAPRANGMAKEPAQRMCPGGGPCNPGACGMN